MSNQKKILLVDDYTIFRSGLKLIIESGNNFKVVSVASNSKELFEQLGNLLPDLIIINLMISPDEILAIIKKISSKYPKIPFIVLSVGGGELVILECVIQGAKGILWKESTSDQLMEAIETVLSGERYLNIPESKMTQEIIQHAHNKHYNNHSFSELSNREQEVLKHFAEGLTYKEIAEKLNISHRTVESHKNNILEKLELHSIIDLVKYAIKHKIIDI